ncbi:MAG: ATP-grasp domain-containing protein, partial [Candidatus Hermodarchaeota archaeon]
MKKTVYIIGAGEYQLPLIKIAKDMGLNVITSDRNPNAIGFKFADKSYAIDIKDKEANLNVAKKNNIDAIVTTSSEFAVRTVAYIGEKLNLKTNSYQSSKLVTDKYLMREALAKNKILMPYFEKISTEKEAISFSKKNNFPIVIKAVDNAGNRGVTIVKSQKEIAPAIKSAYNYSKKKYLLVEEYINGTEHTIEGLIYKNQHSILGISDTTRNPPPYPVDLSLIYPSNKDNSIIEKVKKVVNNSITALGLSIGETHTEVILRDGEPFLIEAAARAGGMHIPSKIIPALTGINMNEELLKMSLGLDNVNIYPKYERSVMLKFLICPPGKLVNIRGLDELKLRDDVIYLYIDYKIGDLVRELKTGGDRAGYLIY